MILTSPPQIVQIPNNTETWATLMRFTQENNIIQFFPDIFERIVQFFPKPHLEIELIQDVEEEYFTLFFQIFTKLSVKEAFQKRREMFQN